MLKKILISALLLAVLLSGCRSARQIETASVIENVSVHRQNGRLTYTFYLLSDSDEPQSVAVPAASFEEARSLAERSYIPHLTLAKLELLLIHRDVCTEVMQGDIEYISSQAGFSPVAHVALCDSGTLEQLQKRTDAQALIERQIDVLRQEYPDLRCDYLRVFNSYARSESFSAPLITFDGELKAGRQSVCVVK